MLALHKDINEDQQGRATAQRINILHRDKHKYA